jgi:hypothetical protein
VGQFLDSAEIFDFIDLGAAIPPLRAARSMTIEDFMRAEYNALLAICTGRADIVAAVVGKGLRLREFYRSLSPCCCRCPCLSPSLSPSPLPLAPCNPSLRSCWCRVQVAPSILKLKPGRPKACWVWL